MGYDVKLLSGLHFSVQMFVVEGRELSIECEGVMWLGSVAAYIAYVRV